MASRIITTFVDDVTGKEFAGDEGETAVVSLGGIAVEVDVAFASEMYAMLKTAHNAGRRVKSNVVSIKSAKSAQVSKAPSDRQRNDDIRQWAKQHGVLVRDRGRIPARVMRAFDHLDPTMLPGYVAPEAPKPQAPTKAAKTVSAVTLDMTEGKTSRARVKRGPVPAFSSAPGGKTPAKKAPAKGTGATTEKVASA